MKRFLALTLIVISFFFISVNEVFGMPNPAAVYCEELGYKFKIVQTERGEDSVCVFFENNTESNTTVVNINNIKNMSANITSVSIQCEAWEFLEGKCGKEYSYCSKHGYDTETINDGKNSFSHEYAVCVPKKYSPSKFSIASLNEKKAVTDLMDLGKKILVNTSLPIKSEREPDINIKSEVLEERKEPLTSIQTSPSTFDWRNKDGKNWVTPVKNQGSCGSCWAFAATGGVEAKIKISRNDSNFDTDLSEQYIVSCSGAGSCNGGWSDSALEYVKNNGMTDEPCFLYQASDVSCSNKCSVWSKRLWKIDGVGYVPSGRENIKSYLIQKGPLVAYLAMDGYFDNGIYRCNNPSGLNHAVLIVGYNDVNNYWIIKNSWGNSWNGNGYFNVGYSECNIESYPSRGPIYIESFKSPSYNIKAGDIQLYTGSKSGSLSDTYYKDGSYMTLSEDCSFLTCNGLDTRLNFSIKTLSNIGSIDLIAYHRARWEGGFNLYYWNEKDSQWNNLGNIPNSTWYLMKYSVCNSINDCSKYIFSGNTTIKYYHSSCTLCDTDYVDMDWLYVETTPSTAYCSASTSNANYEYITRVAINGNEKISGNSTYSDFTNTTLATLNKGDTYTLYVDGHTTTAYTEYVKAWIDFNNDKTFSGNEEIDLGNVTFNGTHTFSKNFTLPMDANISETILRVYLKWNGAPSPCENANYGEVEDYKVNIIYDTTPPSVWISEYGVGYVQVGNTAVINAYVYDTYGVSSAYATIESPDENVLSTIQLYDDGLHNDSLANDSIYGNFWTTSAEEKNYYIDFDATDIHSNTIAYDNKDKFTTIPFLPTSRIILVDNSLYISYINYYENALNSSGYAYNLWDFDLRGEISNDIINSFNLCIWSSPSWKVPNNNQQLVLSQFLDNGGSLFISGQDLGYYINNTNFYQNYLHANYVQDDVNLYVLNGVSGDPVTNGINIGIYGGDGANNQWWPDEINPRSPAVSIFFYSNSSNVSKEYSTLQELPKIFKENINKTKNYGVTGTLSSGTGAIRVNTSGYKVVYFAFGFEAINDTSSRNFVMKKIVNWLVDLIPPDITILSPINQTYNTSILLLNVYVGETAKWIRVSTDNSSNVSCTNCSAIAYNLTSLTEGSHTVIVYASDYENNENSTKVIFTVHTTPPIITITTPTNNTLLAINSTWLNVTTNENATCYYTIISCTMGEGGIVSCSATGPSLNMTTTNRIHHYKLISYLSDTDYNQWYELLISCKDIIENTNSSSIVIYIDTTGPSYSIPAMAVPSVYNPNFITNFSIIWIDNRNVSKQFIEENITGILRNSTMDSIYSIVLPAGSFQYRYLANDTSNNWNSTNIYYLTVNPQSITIYLAFNGDETNVTYEYPTTINATGWKNINEGNLSLYRNEALLITTTGLNSITNISSNLYLGVYNYTIIFNGLNYTANPITRFVTVRDTTPSTISNGVITPTIIRPNLNATLTVTIVDNDIVKYAYLSGYNSSWYLLYHQQNLTNIGNNWFLTFNISDIPIGTYYFNITSVDNSGNSKTVWADNITVNQTSGATNTFTNTSITTVNNQTIIDATQITNTSLEIKTNQSVSNAIVTLATYTENPGTANVGIPALNKYLEITASSNLNNSLSWAIIKVYYNDSDIPSGYNENNLRIYYQDPDGTWTAFDDNLVGGVNTTANYVWANTTHFSIYGIFIKPTCSDGIQNQGETGVDCGGPCSACYSPGPSPGPTRGGGGGGGAVPLAPTQKQTITTNVTNQTSPEKPTPVPQPLEENKTVPTNITGPTPTPTAGIPTGFAILVPYLNDTITILVLLIIVVIVIMYWKKLFMFRKEIKKK